MTNILYMVPTAKEILFLRTFPRQNYHFQDINYTRFKGNESRDMCEKAYHIYSMCNRLLTFLWYNLLLAPSSCLIHPLLFKF